MTTKEKEEVETEREGGTDGPLLDLSDDAVKKMIKVAKKRGYVTMDELNSVLPSEEVTSEQIEDTMAMLSDMGINVVEDDEAGEDADNSPTPKRNRPSFAEQQGTAVATTTKKRADRPHRRSRAHVSARDGHGGAAVARGRNRHRQAHRGRPRDDDRGAVREPADLPGHHHLARRAQRGSILLREIIDLERPMPVPRPSRPRSSSAPTRTKSPSRRSAPVAAARTTTSPMSAARARARIDDDDEDEANLSLAAMEAELRPQVMATLDLIADTYKKLRKLQDQQVENRLAAAGTLSPSQERRYKQLKDELITAVKSLSLNNNRIESLVEQLYDINKRLVQNEGRLLRLAESYKVKREEFLKEYQGSELDPNWIKRISNLAATGWKEFTKNEKEAIRDLRSEIQNLATETGISIPNSGASSTRCRRASARRPSPRRRWSRPTCAS
jgi:RNA polymerase primary sigma factor